MNVRLSFALAALAALVASDTFAQSQLQSTRPRGSTKVRSRLINPFDLSGSQISVDRFGIVTYRASSTAVTSVTPYWASAAVFSAAAGSVAPTATLTTATSSSVASSTASVTPASGSLATPVEGAELAVGASVRPPYRPPVRSPFRPPPRPPF